MARSVDSVGAQWHVLPNLLSFIRAALAIVVLVMAVRGAWVMGFWVLVAALVTDYFDGLAAKKLHAETVIGGHIDRIADFLLATTGMLGLYFGAHTFPVWILYAAVPVSAFFGYVKFFLAEDNRIRQITNIFSVTLLFLVWVYIAWGYLAQAYGWSWLYPPITFVCLVVLAFQKQHRLQAWFGWLFAKSAK